MLPSRVVMITVLLVGACGRSAEDKPAPAETAKPRPAVATDYLALTEQPVGELPDLAYTPAHQDADYLLVEGTSIPLKFYIEPLNERLLDARGAQMQADFQRVLGRTVSDADTQRWKREMLDDLRRRRVAARALLDLRLAGSLTPEELEERFMRLHEGIDLAFRRITGISAEEHGRLAGG